MCPTPTSSERAADREQRERPSTGGDFDLHRRRPPNAEDPHVHQRRLLRPLVAVRGPCGDTERRRFVQAAARSGVRCSVAGERQQRRQRVHLLVDQPTVQTPVPSAGVATLLFQSYWLLSSRRSFTVASFVSVNLMLYESSQSRFSAVPDSPFLHLLHPMNVVINLVQVTQL